MTKKVREFVVVIPQPVEPSARWVRVKLGDEVIAGSRRTLLLLQYGPSGFPTYYFPRDDVRLDWLEPTAGQPTGERMVWNVRVGERVVKQAAWSLLAPPLAQANLKDHITFAWNGQLTWYEEEEEVFVHARDPHGRVDVMPSSRHIRVVIDGQTIAETSHPHVLFETRLPPRYYIPREDIRMELLEPSGLKTRCPYKGVASEVVWIF